NACTQMNLSVLTRNTMEARVYYVVYVRDGKGKRKRDRGREEFKSSRWKCYCKSASRSWLTSSSDAPPSDISCTVHRTFKVTFSIDFSATYKPYRKKSHYYCFIENNNLDNMKLRIKLKLTKWREKLKRRSSLCERVSDHVLYFPKHLRSQNESGRCKKDTGNPEDFMQSSLNG
ncbi:unnamed protein product, partial [Heterotrigona itama]